MTAAHAAALPSALPVEILVMIFNLLELKSLLRASHVSLTWRVLARSQRQFWRFIRLSKLSHSEIAFFAERLACKESNTRSIDVTLDLDKSEDPAGLHAVVLALLARNLFRVEYLRIVVLPSYVSALTDSLHHAAPILKHFMLFYRHSKGETLATPLPVDIFAGLSPRLERVVLRDVQLPPAAIPAFRNVTNLTFVSDVPQPISNCILRHFPFASALTLAGSSCSHTVHGQMPDQSIITPPIDSLYLWMPLPRFERFLAVVPNIADVRRIQCRQASPRLVGALMVHMAGKPLAMELNGRPSKDSVISIAFTCGRLLRDFDELPGVAKWSRSAFFSPDLMARVTILNIHRGLVSLLPILPMLPNCEQLGILWEVGTIDFDILHDAVAPRTGLFLPKLSQVIVHGGRSEARIEAGCLAGLLHAFLHPTQVGLNLKIRREVTITGDIQQLRSRFQLAHLRYRR